MRAEGPTPGGSAAPSATAARTSRVARPRPTRLHRWRVLVGGIVAAGLGVAVFAVTGEPWLLPLSVLLPVVVWYGSFFLAHHEIRAAKVAGGWFENLPDRTPGDTAVDTGPPRFPFYVNRDDHALLVSRRFGIGWTVNLGNPRAVILLAGVAALIGLAVTLRFGG